MEAAQESRPSEWDKRLSTHSPFRTLGINGQPLPSADGVSLPQKALATQILFLVDLTEVCLFRNWGK